jgi:hypothetical protein
MIWHNPAAVGDVGWPAQVSKAATSHGNTIASLLRFLSSE